MFVTAQFVVWSYKEHQLMVDSNSTWILVLSWLWPFLWIQGISIHNNRKNNLNFRIRILILPLCSIVTLETLALKPQFQKINISRETERADL